MSTQASRYHLRIVSGLVVAFLLLPPYGFTASYAQAITSVSLTADHPPPQLSGTTITWTATATGGVAPFTYKWWQFDGSSWTLLQDWSSSATLRWTPPVARANWRVGVWVRNAGSIAEGVCDSFNYCASIEFSIVATCAYAVSPASANVGSEGGHGVVTVATMAGCSWAPNSDAVWLTPGSTSPQQGSGTVSWAVGSNVGSGGSREGRIRIGNRHFTVFQCEQVVSPRTISLPAGSGTVTVQVISSGSCPWTATALQGAFASVTDGAMGTGQGPITIAYSSNPTVHPRTTMVTVAGQAVTLTQAGVTCSYELNPSAVSVGAEGGHGSVTVSAPPGCTWAPNSNASWLTPASTAQQHGSGTVTWTATPNINTGGSREGGILIGNRYFGAFQCEQVVTPRTLTVGPSGGMTAVGIVSSGSCPWTASAPAGSFAQIGSSALGSGQGIVTVTVQPTPSSVSRTTEIVVAGQPVTITQAGAPCAYQLTPGSVVADASGASGALGVTPIPSDCTWAPDSDAEWLSTGDTFPREGSGSVTWRASANASGADRLGSLHIGPAAFQVSQCFYTVSRSFIPIGVSGGLGTLSLDASSPACRWSASSQAPWLTLSGPTSGVGNATLSYHVASNADASSRSAVLHVAGRAVVLSQLGTEPVCDIAVTPDSVTVPAAGATHVVTVMAPSGCAWSALTESSFVFLGGTLAASGSGAFTFTVGNNYSGATDSNPHPERSADIRIGGRVLRITQLNYDPAVGGSCSSVSVSPPHLAFPAGGGAVQFDIGADASCRWTLESVPGWLTLDVIAGQGARRVTATANAASGASARGAVLVVRHSAPIESYLTVLQDGTEELALLSSGGESVDPDFAESAGLAVCTWAFRSSSKNRWLFRAIRIWDGNRLLATAFDIGPELRLRAVANVEAAREARVIHCVAYDTSTVQQPVIGTLSLVVAGQELPTPCTDERADIIAEYIDQNHPLRPTCSSFRQSVPEPSHYSFPAWNQDNDYGWAILHETAVANLYCIVSNHGSPPVMTSGYRNPASQLQINPGSPYGRHTYGDAADLDTPNAPNNAQYDALRALAKGGLCGFACVEPRVIAPRHFHVDYRQACPDGW